jgi:hypothetical protein
MDERGKGRLNFLSREGHEGGEVVVRRADNSPAMNGLFLPTSVLDLDNAG